TPATSPLLFTELWKADTVNAANSKFLKSMDSTLALTYEIENDGLYLVRLQPELLHSVSYNITITTGPSLGFPVSETGKPQLISFWHDPRDAGARSHEGVDIGAV